MLRQKLILTVFLLLCPAIIANISAATIDPYKGRWRVDIERTLESFRQIDPQNIPAAIVNSMKNMSVEFSAKRYIFKSGRREIINSRFEIMSLSDDGVMMRVYVKNIIREQLLVLSSGGELKVIAMQDGKAQNQPFANQIIWQRVGRTKPPGK